MVWCQWWVTDDHPEDLIWMFAGLLDNHDRTHRLSTSSRRWWDKTLRVITTVKYENTVLNHIKFMKVTPSSPPSLPFLTLLDCENSRELMTGGDVGPHGTDWVCIESSLSKGLVLYISLSVFAYSSNIFITSFDLMVSMAVCGTLKTGFVCKSCSFITWRTRSRDEDHLLNQSSSRSWWRMVLLRPELTDSYWSSPTCLACTTYWSVKSDIHNVVDKEKKTSGDPCAGDVTRICPWTL